MHPKSGKEWRKLFRSWSTSLSDFWDTCEDQEGGGYIRLGDIEQLHEGRAFEGILDDAGTYLNEGERYIPPVIFQDFSCFSSTQSSDSSDDEQGCFSTPMLIPEAYSEGEGHRSTAKEFEWPNHDQAVVSDRAHVLQSVVLSSVQGHQKDKKKSCETPMTSHEDYTGDWFAWEANDSTSASESDSESSICHLQHERREDSSSSRPTLLPLLNLHIRETSQEPLVLKKMLTPIWKMLASHRFVGPFMRPVREKQAPGYQEIVKRPMDLTTIKRGLSKGRIKTTVEFQRDVLLMLFNAIMYNSHNHSVYQKAVEMQKDTVELLQVLLNLP